MNAVEEDVFSTPAILRQTMARAEELEGALAHLLQGPMIFLGCGSSYCVGVAAATLYEMECQAPAQGIIASEYRLRPGWAHLAISRTGRTTELIQAMRSAREAQERVALIVGDPGSPAAEHADAVLPLEFAPERGVVQTRFITAALLALRLVIGGAATQRALHDLPDELSRALIEFDATPLTSFEHVVFLGRGWRYGLALSAALTMQETALLVSEGYQTLEYRHGPIAAADEGTLVWCIDEPDDPVSAGVLDDVRRTGATVRCIAGDPLATLAQIHLLAVRMAESRGIDPDAPRHLSRAIVLPTTGL